MAQKKKVGIIKREAMKKFGSRVQPNEQKPIGKMGTKGKVSLKAGAGQNVKHRSKAHAIGAGPGGHGGKHAAVATPKKMAGSPSMIGKITKKKGGTGGGGNA